MTIELVIDNRERHLIEALGECKMTVETLDIGDILFREGEEVILIIERKTIADLKASICDGRAREQKARLLHSSGIHVSRIMYLIEGNLDKPLKSNCQGLPVSTLLGSLINTQLRDGIKVYKTASLKESSAYICKLLDKLQKDGDKYFKQEAKCMTAGQYSATLSKVKKANMTKEVWFLQQLSLIPGVTETTAEPIVAKYPTVSTLVLEYQRTPEHLRSKLLEDLTFTRKTGKTEESR